jgi:hypothetical protein
MFFEGVTVKNAILEKLISRFFYLLTFRTGGGELEWELQFTVRLESRLSFIGRDVQVPVLPIGLKLGPTLKGKSVKIRK